MEVFCDTKTSFAWARSDGNQGQWDKLKNNKSPGPDGLPVEFYKLLDEAGLELVLDILNDCWTNETMPEEMELAELVTLYKKGNVKDPANYRPISLLNTFYKLYGSII